MSLPKIISNNPPTSLSPPTSPTSPTLSESSSFIPHFVQALHDYLPSSTVDIDDTVSCLYFKKGSIIEVFNRDDSGWWDGQCGDVRGWFPSNYVGRIGELKRSSLDFDEDDSISLVLESWHQKMGHQSNSTLPVLLDEYSTKSLSIQGRLELNRNLFKEDGKSIEVDSLEQLHTDMHVLNEEVTKKVLDLVDICTSQPSQIQLHSSRVVASVRAVLSEANIINKESSLLKLYPELTRQRKIILNGLNQLIVKAKEPQPTESISVLAHQLLTEMDVFENILHSISRQSSYTESTRLSSMFDNTPRSSVSSLAYSLPVHSSSSLVRHSFPLDQPGILQTVANHQSTIDDLMKSLISTLESYLTHRHRATDMLEITRKAMESVMTFLSVVEHVCSHVTDFDYSRRVSMMPEDPNWVTLVITKESVYSAITNLVTAVRALTGASSADDPSLLKDDYDHLCVCCEGVIKSTHECAQCVREFLLGEGSERKLEAGDENYDISTVSQSDHLDHLERKLNTLTMIQQSLGDQPPPLELEERILSSSTLEEKPTEHLESTLENQSKDTVKVLESLEEKGIGSVEDNVIESVNESEVETTLENTIEATVRSTPENTIETTVRSTPENTIETIKEILIEPAKEKPFEPVEEKVTEAAIEKLESPVTEEMVEGLDISQPDRSSRRFSISSKESYASSLNDSIPEPMLSAIDSIIPENNPARPPKIRPRAASVNHTAQLEPTVPKDKTPLRASVSTLFPAPTPLHSSPLKEGLTRSRGLSVSSFRSSFKTRAERSNSSATSDHLVEPPKLNRLPSWVSQNSTSSERSDGTFQNEIRPPSTLLEMATRGSDQSFLNQYTFTEDELIVNSDNEITGATLEALVRKLTLHEKSPDLNFMRAFFYNFRLFSNPIDLVQLLIKRFMLQPPNHPEPLSEEQLKIWTDRILIPVRLRVYNVFKTWLENYFSFEQDACIESTLMDFALHEMTEAIPAPAKRMVELLTRTINSKGLNVNSKRQNFADNRIIMQRSISTSLQGSLTGSGSHLFSNLSRSDEYADSNAYPPVIFSKSQRYTLKKHLTKKTVMGMHISDIDPIELARQLTIMENDLFCKIQYNEMIGQEFKKKVGKSQAIHVKAMIQKSTQITSWVSDTILNESELKKRSNLLKYWIKVGDACLQLQNYNTLMAIRSALDSTSISRLKKTWDYLSIKYKTIWESIYRATDSQRNFAEYRQRLKKSIAPCLPFLGVYLTDLTFIDDGNSGYRTTTNGIQLINFDKYLKTTRVLNEIDQFQIQYKLTEVEEIQKYLNLILDTVEQNDQLFYKRSLQREPKEEDS